MHPSEALQQAVREHPYPLLFATISGAHLYGFPSPDSDYDLRGAHILPAEQILGINPLQETVEVSRKEPIDLDLVTHDVRKFFLLLLKNNGYVLEQIYSPLIVYTSPEHEELKSLARGCITKHHVHHYLGFANNQWNMFAKESPRRVKPLLYVFRVLLTGIHLMRTGEIEANLANLNGQFKVPYISELINQKRSGAEQQTFNEVDYGFFESEFTRLRTELEEAGEQSKLLDHATAKPALNDLLVRLREKSA